MSVQHEWAVRAGATEYARDRCLSWGGGCGGVSCVGGLVVVCCSESFATNEIQSAENGGIPQRLIDSYIFTHTRVMCTKEFPPVKNWLILFALYYYTRRVRGKMYRGPFWWVFLFLIVNRELSSPRTIWRSTNIYIYMPTHYTRLHRPRRTGHRPRHTDARTRIYYNIYCIQRV